MGSAKLSDFKSIAEHAAKKNRALNITGILLFKEGVIFQVLEGEKDSVETLFNCIEDDPRHSAIVKMISRTAIKREFPNWSMGFAEMTELQASELTFLLNKQTFASIMPVQPKDEVLILSSTYARVSKL